MRVTKGTIEFTAGIAVCVFIGLALVGTLILYKPPVPPCVRVAIYPDNDAENIGFPDQVFDHAPFTLKFTHLNVTASYKLEFFNINLRESTKIAPITWSGMKEKLLWIEAMDMIVVLFRDGKTVLSLLVYPMTPQLESLV